jgi:hypothetical protein
MIATLRAPTKRRQKPHLDPQNRDLARGEPSPTFFDQFLDDFVHVEFHDCRFGNFQK